MLSSNLVKSKISMSSGGGVGGPNFQLLMLSSNLLKSKIPMSSWGGGGWWNQLSTFDAESKFALKKFLFAKNFLSFWPKIGKVLFWILNTEWFAILCIANHNEYQPSKATSTTAHIDCTELQ